MTEKLIPYDASYYLDDGEDIALFLGFAAEDAANENDPAILARAIKTIAKARGMTELAKQALPRPLAKHPPPKKPPRWWKPECACNGLQ